MTPARPKDERCAYTDERGLTCGMPLAFPMHDAHEAPRCTSNPCLHHTWTPPPRAEAVTCDHGPFKNHRDGTWSCVGCSADMTAVVARSLAASSSAPSDAERLLEALTCITEWLDCCERYGKRERCDDVYRTRDAHLRHVRKAIRAVLREGRR